ncbi:hypothetical protein GHT06_015175 [Daphnia sinensis]|uniref:Uncharacterized protein n=1 Tax=Daphnia sinensis TaxID=1820382 RepID=A0AAD5LAK6_9CRUS|nr:hypothetical protein GHT06_015175 [Daphnia sinensis]
MDDQARFAANNAAARIAATSRSRPVSPPVDKTITDAAVEAAAQAVVFDPVTTEVAQLTRLRTTTRRQTTNTCTQLATAIRKGESRSGLKSLVEYVTELLKEARDIDNNRLLEGAEPEEFDRQHEAHTSKMNTIEIGPLYLIASIRYQDHK